MLLTAVFPRSISISLSAAYAATAELREIPLLLHE